MRRNCFLVIVLLALTHITFAQKDTRPYILSSSSDSTVKVIRKENEPITVIIQEAKDKPDKSGKVSEANTEVLDVIIEFKESALFAKRQQRVAIRKSDYSARFTRLENDLRGIHQRMARSAGAAPAIRKRYYKTFHGVNVSIPKNSYAEIAALPYVKSIYPNETVQAYLNESVPLIQANQVWTQLGAQGEGMVVGIIDTGIDYHHPDLGNGFGPSFKVIGGYDFVNNDTDPMDDHKHGTHCAGIVAADGVIKGVAPKAKLVALKALDNQGNGTWDNILAAIEWTSDPNNDDDDSDHLQIVSISLGGRGNANDPVSTAVDNAAALGTIFCIAAGNDGDYGAIGSPGTARQAITVGSTDMADVMAPTSSKGPNLVLQSIKPEVVAPGVDIYSTVLNGGYENQSGTSMATPHVAGLVALLKQLHPTWSPQQIKSALVTTAKILATPDVMAHGGGRIESLKAAQVTSFAVPSVVSFGSIDVTQPVYTATQVITVSNEHTSAQTYTAAAGIPAPGIGVTISPTAFTLAPGQSQVVMVTLTVDNSTVPNKPNPPYAYDGFINITGTRDSLHVPWAFTKITQLYLEFDLQYPIVLVGNELFGIDSRNAVFAADGLSATMVFPPGVYDVAVLYARNEFVKVVVREDVSVSGFQTLSMPSSLAKNKVSFAPVGDDGSPIMHDRKNYYLASSASKYISMSTHSITNYDEYWFSDLSARYKLYFFNLAGTFQGTKLYAIEYPVMSGISQPQALTVDPTAYTGRDVVLNLATDDETRNMRTYVNFRRTELYTSLGKTFGIPGHDVWQGKIFVTEHTNPTIQYTLSIANGDRSEDIAKEHFKTSEFSVASGKLGAYLLSPPQPDIFLADVGQNMTFGSGAIFPMKLSQNYTWDVGFFGQLEESKRNLRWKTTYEVYDAGGSMLSSGPLTSLTQGNIQPGYNKIIYRTNGYKVKDVAGHGTLTKIFNYQGLQSTPDITSLQIRDHHNAPAEILENGATNSIRFSVDDETLVQSSVKLYIKAGGTDTWQEQSINLIAQTAYGMKDACGNLYKADFEQLPFPVGTVDLKINAADGQGNFIEWILEPAFVLEDNNKAPIITGQQPVATGVNLARTINFSDLVVQDVDNAYPTGFSLKVFLGSNYTLQGNTITPAPGYGGMLSVPVRVNDGLENSNIYNVQISVGTGLSLDSLALVQLYHTAGGDNWNNKTNWLTGRLSTWYGVSVVGGRVARLQIPRNNLVGTADFTFGLDKLSYLEFNGNHLTRVDVSSAKGLEYMYIQRNPMTTLVTNATPDYYDKLKGLDVRLSDLSTADISNMPALLTAYFDGSYTTSDPRPRLTQLVTNHTPQYYPGLTRLIVQNCAVPTVNLSGMPALLRLDAGNGALTSLDISTNTALEYLMLLNNSILSLNIDSHPALQTVDARTNRIVSFVTNESANYYPALTVLRLTRNDVDHVDISNMPALETVEMGVASGPGTFENSNLTEVVINTADNYYPNLTVLQIQYTAISSLDVRNMKSLITFNCPHNHLTSLNITGLTKLKTLGVSYNQLTELNISECPDIEAVTAQINQLTDFVTNQTPDYYGALRSIAIQRNYIPGLDIRNMPALESITAGDVPGGSSTISTQFTTILTNTAPNYYPVLGTIAVAYTVLSSLDVRSMPALRSLSVNRGALSSIDLTQNPALTSIILQYNQLTNLQMNAPTFYPALTTLNVIGNKLTFDYLEPHIGQPYAFTYVTQTPVINAPYTENVAPGGAFTLTTVTPGTSNLYQWQRKTSPTAAWVAVAGETAATLTRSNATTANAGIYRCAVTSTLVTGVTLYRQEITIRVQAAASSARLMADGAEEGSENISLYPVPADDQLTVNIGNASKAISVDLTNSAGVVVGQVQAPQGNVSIDTRDIAAGIYFVKIRTAGALVVRKVAIIH